MIEDSVFKYSSRVDGAKGIVFIGEKLLVYRRDFNTDRYPGKIDVPGGGSDEHESPFDTFVREVSEEFGLTVTEENLVFAKEYQSTIKPEKTGFHIVVELPTAVEKDVVFGNEGSEWMLMSVDEYLNAKDAWPVFQERTKDYLNSLST